MQQSDYSNNLFDKEEWEVKKYRTYNQNKKYFCVFRVGKSMKSLSDVAKFEQHMERTMDVPNANLDKSKENRVLIGEGTPYDIALEYMEDVDFKRKNANIAKDLVLTTNKEFFDRLAPGEVDIWIDENIKFLKDSFGENCVYATLHLDETTPHIHALIIPKFYNKERDRVELRSNVYFDGKNKLRLWQTQYANHMSKRFNNLVRGIMGSKARHIELQTYYSIIQDKQFEENQDVLLAKAKESFLLKKQLEELQQSVANSKTSEEKELLERKLRITSRNNEIYKETIRIISREYGVNENEILKIVKSLEGKEKDNQREREL